MATDGGHRRGDQVANESGLAALGRQVDFANSSRSARRRKRRLRRWLLVSVVCVLVLVAGGTGYLYYVTHDLNRVEVQGLHRAFTNGQEAGTENILMVGSTSRCALAHQNPIYGLCQGSADSPPVNGINSDVIMILHVDPAHHRLALLSIPRDLFIPNARSTGANKIDAGLVQGMTQVVAAIEEDFGIPIQHAVSLNFDQFANIVQALGGINMTFPESLFDNFSHLNIQAARCVHLDGEQALEVVRARHLQYDPPGTTASDAFQWPREALSDLARIRRDHEFLRVLATAVAKQGLADPFTDLSLVNSVKADLTFDQSWPVSDMAHLALDFHSVNVDSVPQLTLPVAIVTDPAGPSGDGAYIYKGGNYEDVEFTSGSQDQAVIDEVLGIGPATDSMTGKPLPTPSSVTVSVLNGSGTSDQAATTSNALGALGFQVIGGGDTAPVGDVAETVVYYGSRSPDVEAAAEAVARSMSGAVVMAYAPGEVVDHAQVTVVTGTQFAVNPPTPPPAGTSHHSTAPRASVTTTTTTTAAVAPSSAIAPPNSPVTNLAPWDPRSCPAGARPTAPAPNQT